MTSLARSVHGSPATLFASNGSAGTYGAHYAFPDAATLPDGTEVVVCRKSTSHAKYDGDFVVKTRASGGSWSSEAVIFAGLGGQSASGSGVDWRMMDLRVLANGDLAGVAYYRTGSLAGGSDGDRFYPVFTKCPAGSNPRVAASWTTPVLTWATGPSISGYTATSDLLELPNGDLLLFTYGGTTIPRDDYRCDVYKSTDGGATWAWFSELFDPADTPGHTYGMAEPQVERLDDGTVYAIYRAVASPWEVWAKTSTDDCATWSAETLIASNVVNRVGLCLSPDGDLILPYNEFGTALKFRQKFGSAAWGSAVSCGGPSANVFASPYNIGTPGVTPDAAIVYADEVAGQTQASVSRLELTRGSDVVLHYATGYGNTVSAGYGDAETYTPPPASITVDPASTVWQQSGTSIIARVNPDGPAAVSAVVEHTDGGLVRFRGANASRFEISLDGATWASTATVAAGATDVFLRVTPEPEDSGATLVAEIGVPV